MHSQPASGPRTSYVGVTTGLLRAMPKRELEAVLAHEISHIRHRDTYLMTMATVFAGVIALVADIGFRSLAYRRTVAEGRRRCRHRRDRRVRAGPVRGHAAPDEPVAPAGVPRRCGLGGDPQRPGSDGARSAAARSRTRRPSVTRSPRSRISGSRVPRTVSNRSAQGCLRSPVSSTRIPHSTRELRRSKRPVDSGSQSDLPSDVPFAAEIGLA